MCRENTVLRLDLIERASEHAIEFWCTFWQFAFSVQTDLVVDLESLCTCMQHKSRLNCENSSHLGCSSNTRVTSSLWHLVTMFMSCLV